MIEVLAARQFEAVLGEKLEIPAEYKAGYTCRFAIKFEGEILDGRCGAWEIHAYDIILRHVLIDTSHRHNGMTLKAIQTYYPWVSVAFTPIMIMPLADDGPEKEE